jgi:hypothetical protein
MPAIVSTEYRNQNSLRAYPFEDDATLLDNTGLALPIDFLVDAFLYPIDLVNNLYLSRLDLNTRRVYFADTVTGTVHGFADIDTNLDYAFVYDSETYMRQVGILTLGDGRSNLFQGLAIRDFEPAATTLAPTTYIALVQEGVRGIMLPDGTIFTGDVQLEGQNGVVVTSSAGSNIVKIDIVGVPESNPEDCGDDCPPIQEICFERAPGSVFMISQYDAVTVALNTYAFTLDDLCGAQKARKLPDAQGNLPLAVKPGDDPCEIPPIPPGPPDPGPAVNFCITVSSLNGNLTIITPSAGGDFNPVNLKTLDHQGALGAAQLQVPQLATGTDVDAAAANFANPPTFADGLSIGLKGLALYSRRNK